MGDFSEDDVERDSDGKFAPSGGSAASGKEKVHPAREAGRRHGKEMGESILKGAEKFQEGAEKGGEHAVAVAGALIDGSAGDVAREAGRAAFGGDGGEGKKRHEGAREAGRRHGEAMANEENEGEES